MGDGSIQNFQIFASSGSKHHPPSAARPSSVGWCIDRKNDMHPWIMVRAWNYHHSKFIFLKISSAFNVLQYKIGLGTTCI